MSDGYGVDLAAIHASGFTEIAEAAARELLARLSRPARVLDLGCGDGTSAALLAEAGHEVHGLDLSPAAIELARRRAPSATFAVGSFLDAPLPVKPDAVLAAGEVLGYAIDERVHPDSLHGVLDRISEALNPDGGLLLFDLATPDRGKAGDGRAWTEGDGWTVLVETESTSKQLTASMQLTASKQLTAPQQLTTSMQLTAPKQLTRRIVTFRELDGGRYRRAEEVHTLNLYWPDQVLATLRSVGLTAQVLAEGYAGLALPPGLTAYLGRRG